MSQGETQASTSRPWFERFSFDQIQVVSDPYMPKDQIFAVGPTPPGSLVKMNDTYDWGIPGNNLRIASEPGGKFTITPVPPPDHRYDKILEEFGASTVKPVTRNDSACLTVIPALAEQPFIRTPPPGAFPEPEPETVLEFPEYTEREIGRWCCSVVVVIRQGPNPKAWTKDVGDKAWLQAEPLNDETLPTYQRLMFYPVSAGKDFNKLFLDWVAEIEANPECCVKHKLIGRYDGEACVGQRSTRPPVALAPEAAKKSEEESLWAYGNSLKQLTDNLFQQSPVFTRLSTGKMNFGFSGFKQADGGKAASGNITVSSPREGYKMYGILDKP